jgi:hypothetical protein
VPPHHNPIHYHQQTFCIKFTRKENVSQQATILLHQPTSNYIASSKSSNTNEMNVPVNCHATSCHTIIFVSLVIPLQFHGGSLANSHGYDCTTAFLSIFLSPKRLNHDPTVDQFYPDLCSICHHMDCCVPYGFYIHSQRTIKLSQESCIVII